VNPGRTRTLSVTREDSKNFARRLAESMRNHRLPADPALPGQIRFQPPWLTRLL
jgi:hypothetical protein